ncbi:MAG: TIR domain-containing protein [Opitutaceae bacterium]|nr:TIR domain-containing protein [Opitutaceae bacterium]
MSEIPGSPSPASRAVFVSYSHDDAGAARRITESLRAAGLEVWFDENELRGGDTWDQKIKQQIRDCALFLPVISQGTQRRREGYFRLEWHLAEERSRLIARGTPFLVPVAIDDTTERGALVPEVFLSVQWTRLRDGAATPAFVERVKQLLGNDSAMEPGRPRPGKRGEDVASPASQPVSRRVPAAAWIALAAVAVAVSFMALRPSPDAGAGTRPPSSDKATPAVTDKSIAVLPFTNLSPDKENEFFADGMHADLLSNLLSLRELRVISAQSVSGYRGTTKRIPEIARELGVAHILTGSVRRAGDAVRVSAQLIDARTDVPIWSPQPYTKKLTDIFAIQTELAQSIAAELKATLTPEEKKFLARRPTENTAAYDLYLKGILEGGSGRAGYEHTERYMRAAVDLDPKFIEAWGWLLRVQTFIYRNYDLTEERLRTTTATYEILKRLAPDSTATILPFARYALWVLGDFERATAEAERYVRLLPNDPEGYFLLEVIQFRQGRLFEAVANLRKSIALEPTYLGYRYNLIGPLEGCRRYEEVVLEYQSILKYEPDSATVTARIAIAIFRSRGSVREGDAVIAALPDNIANSSVGITQRLDWAEKKGDLAEFTRLHGFLKDTNGSGRAAIQHVLRLALVLAASGDRTRASEMLAPHEAEALRRAVEARTDLAAWRLAAEVAAVLRHKDEAMQCVRQLGELQDPRLRPAQSAAEKTSTLAFVHAWLGDTSRAIAEYEKLFLMPFSGLSVHEMRRHPRYFPLRGDPRFEALVNDPKNNAPLF